MRETETVIRKLKCLRCEHEWFPNRVEKPRLCPACHSPYWDIERRLKTRKAARSRAKSEMGALPGLHSFEREKEKQDKAELDINQILKKIESNKNKISGYGVKKVGVFGSFTRNEQKEGSDIDVLVEFKHNQKNFHNYMQLKFFLEELFGRKVDLVIKESIKSRLKDEILGSAVYAT